MGKGWWSSPESMSCSSYIVFSQLNNIIVTFCACESMFYWLTLLAKVDITQYGNGFRLIFKRSMTTKSDEVLISVWWLLNWMLKAGLILNWFNCQLVNIMGFFDSLVKAGTSALSAIDDAATKGYIDSWKSMKRMSETQLKSVVKQHGSSNAKSAIAIAAYAYNGHSIHYLSSVFDSLEGGAKENKESAKRKVSSLAKKMSTESGRDAEELTEYLGKASDQMKYL
ncbi:hypothetical protein VCRA2117O143_390042 [Vibrio crassostreae]|nr:hypothetical protein VCRA2117O143_390042 [Vibrio crassostreae]CAK2353046.1 hypothetical protein VCRA2117O142_380010 [Vibrio crassostreae]CAK2910683.1 hypothetical protein VCRA2119O146_370010 [Vibrio crassostreae]